jgi:formylglycine-generating enzyme required for sulfatase activity
MATPDGFRPSPSAQLGEALRWLVEHREGNSAELTPGPLELAELLWLASCLPEPPKRRTAILQDQARTAPDVKPQDNSQTRREDHPDTQPQTEESSLSPDPFLPSPFPQETTGPAQSDPLLPVAVLPGERDVDRDLEGMALPGRVQEVGPLGDREKLFRALAPLLQRRPDPRRLRFDEERTVDLYAQTHVLQPIFEPCQGPTFEEVLLLLDSGISMQVWRREAEELTRVLASTQVFPQVRLQPLQPMDATRNSDPEDRRKEAVNLARAVQQPSGSSPLTLLITDTAGRHWWDGRMFTAIEVWGRRGPMAILHVLPMWHWPQTSLAALERVSVRNANPAHANPSYGAHPVNWWESPLPPGRDLPMPVLPLDRDGLATWSAVVMGDSAYASAGVAMSSGPLREQRLRQLLGNRDLSAPSPAPEPLNAAQAKTRWEAFQSHASPDAQQLMKAVASSPLLTLPVIRLIKEAMLPEVVGSLPMAEVLTSGLVVRIPGQQEGGSLALSPEQIQFELPTALATLLQDQLPATDRRDVISRVSALVERRWNLGRQPGEPSFEALLCDPTVQPPERLKNGLVHFASVAARLLETLPGNDAKAFAERIRRGSGLPPGSPWPASMAFEEEEFETAQLLDVPQLQAIPFTTARFAELELGPIPFTTATLKSDHTIQESPGTSWGFHDPLQRDHLPFAAIAEQADPLALTLVQIPAGSFLMGSPPDEPERFDSEGPQHEVTLASFFISQTPITQAQWLAVAEWQSPEGEKWERELKANPSRFQPKDEADEKKESYGSFRLLEGEASSDQRPVEQVSWEDAMEFCRRLSQRTGRHYTLPSEAQWEYACQAGKSTPFAFGDTITPELANYDWTYTYGNGPKGKNRKQTTPVGMFPANAWGLQDMHGNVREWCLDDWHGSYEGAPVNGSAWVDGAEGNVSKGGVRDKLLRGGSWGVIPRNCRSAYRLHYGLVLASNFVGFRVVCLPQGPSLNA